MPEYSVSFISNARSTLACGSQHSFFRFGCGGTYPACFGFGLANDAVTGGMRFGECTYDRILAQTIFVELAIGSGKIPLLGIKLAGDGLKAALGMQKPCFKLLSPVILFFQFPGERSSILFGSGKLCSQSIVRLRDLRKLALKQLCFFAHHCVTSESVILATAFAVNYCII